MDTEKTAEKVWTCDMCGDDHLGDRCTNYVGCLVDSHHGVYAAQIFAEHYPPELFRVDPERLSSLLEDFAILKAGPDFSETTQWYNLYWEAANVIGSNYDLVFKNPLEDVWNLQQDIPTDRKFDIYATWFEGEIIALMRPESLDDTDPQ